MIPGFRPDGTLPPGEHEATWREIVQTFGTTPHRRGLLAGLRRALQALRDAGCRRAYIDGSFVTTTPLPRDYDGCWETLSVDADALDPVLLDLDFPRTQQKEKYGGEMFPASWPADRQGRTFRDFFQADRDGNPKGIVVIDLVGGGLA